MPRFSVSSLNHVWLSRKRYPHRLSRVRQCSQCGRCESYGANLTRYECLRRRGCLCLWLCTAASDDAADAADAATDDASDAANAADADGTAPYAYGRNERTDADDGAAAAAQLCSLRR